MEESGEDLRMDPHRRNEDPPGNSLRRGASSALERQIRKKDAKTTKRVSRFQWNHQCSPKALVPKTATAHGSQGYSPDAARRRRCGDDAAKLEQLRRVISAEIEGRKLLLLETAAHVESLARSVEECERTTFVDELGVNCQDLLAGSRVVMDKKCVDKASVVAAIRQTQPNDFIEILTRPFGTARSPPVNGFAEKLISTTEFAKRLQALDTPQLFDRM